MAKRKEPDTRCQLWLLGRNCKARRCTNPAYGWDAHHRRACLVHMPKALLPAELKQQPNDGGEPEPTATPTCKKR